MEQYTKQVNVIRYDGTNLKEIKRYGFVANERINTDDTKTLYLETNYGMEPVEVGDYLIQDGEEHYVLSPEKFHGIFTKSFYNIGE